MHNSSLHEIRLLGASFATSAKFPLKYKNLLLRHHMFAGIFSRTHDPLRLPHLNARRQYHIPQSNNEQFLKDRLALLDLLYLI